MVPSPLRCLSFLALFAVSASGFPARGDTIDVASSADMYVKDTAEMGEQKALAVAARGEGNNRKIYLSFDVGGAVPYGKTIRSAALRMTVSAVPEAAETTMPLGVYGIVDNKDKWEPGVMNWTTAPKNDVRNAIGFAKDGVAPLGIWNLDLERHAPPNPMTAAEFSSPELTAFLNWAIGKAPRPVPSASLSDDDKVVTLMICSEIEKSSLVHFVSGNAAFPKARPTLVLELQ